MAWKELSRVNSRELFIDDWLQGRWSIAELCRRHEISRKTGYKTLERYDQGGRAGLKDQSRRPHWHPATVAPEVAKLIIAARQQRPEEGAATLLERLRIKHPRVPWPAPSTAHQILRDAGLVVQRQTKRRACPTQRDCLTEPLAANHVLSVDFKGDFPMGNGRRCYPLTVSDNYSRFLLRCVALEQGNKSEDYVRAVLEACFHEYGLPDMIRSDNGPPFASTGLLGLTKLSVWWMRLGIWPERIEPGKPQQNGRHERMHRTLKRNACKPARHDLRSQQDAFDEFVNDYNHHRPHQALQMKRPIELYSPSKRQMPSRLEPVQYPSAMLVRKVKDSGRIKLDGQEIHISAALLGEYLGLRFEDDDRHATVYFDQLPLGTIDLLPEQRKLKPAKNFGGASPPNRQPTPPESTP